MVQSGVMTRSEDVRDRHRVLHIGGHPAVAALVRETLAADPAEAYDVAWADSLPGGLAHLERHGASVLLLDAQLSDALRAGEWQALRQAVGAAPILVFGTDTSDATEASVIRAGADGYLLAAHLDTYWWPRLLGHAIARSRAAEALADARGHFEMTLDSLGDAVICTDLSGQVTHLNRMAEAITGWSRAATAGRPLQEILQLIDGETRERTDPLDHPSAASPSSSFHRTTVVLQQDGTELAVEQTASPVRDPQGRTVGAVIALRDMSTTHALSARLTHLASHDPLTDLPNRLLLGDRLARALSLAGRHGRRLAVLYLDLDRFKHVNDSLGHHLGDALLREVGQELILCVRSSDTVSRLGGDEFVVVLSELEHVEDAAIGAQKILRILGRPRQLSGHDVRVTASVGISVYPDDGSDAESLLRNADLALYHAKARGRNTHQFFERELNVRAVERRRVEAGLHRALDRREFELHYQPKVNLRTGTVVGAEALLRWRDPALGLIEPARFVPIAEDCGLITPIGRWVIAEACRQAQAWQEAGLRAMPVSVNVSAIEFRDADFLATITGILGDTGLDPRYLEIEITESVLMAHADATYAALHGLKQLGVRLAIDDFGTGWSSLSYLRRLPIDTLKVDKSFLEGVTVHTDLAPIVSAVIAMGRSLNHRVIAEGVETAAQLAFLRAEDCDEAQGYYFSRPVAAQSFMRGLDSGDLIG